MLTSLLIAALLVPPQSPPSRDSVTEAEIRVSYATLIRIDAVAPTGRADTGFALHVVAPPAGHLLSSFFRDHELWFTYLVQNGRGFQLPGLDGPPTPGAAKPGRESAAVLQTQFVRRLVADSQFNGLVIPAIVGHLRASGVRVASALRSPGRKPIVLDLAMPAVVRFFYPNLLINDRIATHICTVFNAVRELPSRNLALEALAFSAINRDIELGDSSRIEEDFGPARKLMSSLDTPGPEELRLQRAQGVMWGVIFDSKQLRAVLLADALRQADVLPFEFSTP